MKYANAPSPSDYTPDRSKPSLASAARQSCDGIRHTHMAPWGFHATFIAAARNFPVRWPFARGAYLTGGAPFPVHVPDSRPG